MEYESIVQYFYSDEDSINRAPPSFMNSVEEEDNSKFSNKRNEYLESPIKKKLNFNDFNNFSLEIEERDKVEDIFDIFSDNENDNDSKYSDDSSFTWGNGDKVYNF